MANHNLAKLALALHKKSKGKIILPIDVVWKNDEAFDIGPNTIKHYQSYLKGAKTIFWSGPLGVIEEKDFIDGSKVLAMTAINSTATTIFGGGNSAQMLENLGLRGKASFVSTGGSALLELLGGRVLPGIRALG